MDKLTKWSAYIVDLRSLFSEWERRHQSGAKWTRRFREIHSICMFTLCVEHKSQQRYLIGFQNPGLVTEGVTINRLFDGDIGEVEDCDFLLVDDPKGYGEASVPHHRCQLVGFLNQSETTEAVWARFLEKKKLRVPPDDDLRLVIHIEQEGWFNYEFLHLFLKHRIPPCPYSQVFTFGQTGNNPRKWTCHQVHPVLATLPELTEDDAKALVVDREQYCKPRNAAPAIKKSLCDAVSAIEMHGPGIGRHKCRLGALLAELPNGVRFAVGTGLSDAERDNPPAVGSTITFRYQELTDGGVPRFPSYVGVRSTSAPKAPSPEPTRGELFMASATTKRRFTFVGGGSDKFWEIEVNNADVVVRYGRNGTAGQTNTKACGDAAAAQKHADKLILEKTGKGYVEVK